MDSSRNLEKDRLVRLRNLNTVLGQPDLLTILKTTTINSFLSHKKTIEKEQNFVFGLNFPTTAHFSSYINNKIKAGSKNGKSQTTYKIKLYIFDAFKRVDFQIQINIPGSLELKAFTLNGQPFNISNVDYESAYFSSILRSLYPHFYHPSTEVYGQIDKYEILEEFIQKYVPFALKNQLPYVDELNEIENLGIELLVVYLKQNSFHNLCNVLLRELTKFYSQRALIFSLELKELKSQFKEIVAQCAQSLLKQKKQLQENRKLSEFQVRALCKIKRKKQAKIIGQYLIKQGLDCLQSWEEILKISFEGDDDRDFFKLINTAVTFAGEEVALKKKIQKHVIPKKIPISLEEMLEQRRNISKQITNHPEYIFKFDYKYMEIESKLKILQDFLDKTQKQKPTLQILHRLDFSYKQESFFQKFIALYQKQKGWNKLLEQRAQCFWLENDYQVYQSSIRKKQSEMSYRFINESFGDLSQTSINNGGSKRKIQENVMAPRQQQQPDEDQVASMDQSFEGEFSESQSENQKQIGVIAPCSKRVATKRVLRELKQTKKPEFTKILCNYNLEKIFLMAYSNLRLQIDLDKWASKLNFQAMNQISSQKKQLIAYVFLKKGFFHLNMLRYRKSEEAFKLARRCSNSVSVSLISCYCLAKLYLEHNNIKGVQFYTVEIVRILYSIGIQNYEVVPTWAKQIVPYIIKHHGKAIIKRLQGPLRQIVQLWLKIDHKTV